MAISNKIENFHMEVNKAFLARAQALDPVLHQTRVRPAGTVDIVSVGADYAARPVQEGFSRSKPMGKGDRICLDFGDHQVGYLSFTLTPEGSPPDAPAFLRLRFGEIPYEIGADVSGYQGEISRSWFQEELIHVDVIPSQVPLPRRYAFRYVEITVLDTSPKYKVVLEDAVCTAVTSGDRASLPPLHTDDPELLALDRVSLKTMENCMQSVFEDGPKRDRRLWLGDLRLQAQVNYLTFRNNDLVKRCLYLFAALTQNEGRVGACLFMEPAPQVDDTALFDYSLFFVSCLHDYYEATGDRETLAELFPTALRQIELALRELDERGIVRDRDSWWCFLDWGDGLNKQAGAQAILIYTLKQAGAMADWLGETDRAASLGADTRRISQAALDCLWDGKQGFFVSGAQRQVSWVSQVWFVLAGVLSREENVRLLERLMAQTPGVPMVTPYAYHHFIQALMENGLTEQAVSAMKGYWGGMLRAGADTFWELYDPGDPLASPYGSRAINSFCHAWSSTPAYFIRKYLAS